MKRVAVLPPAARPISKSVTSSGGEGVAAPGAALGEAAEGDEGEGGCSGRRNPKTKAAPATPPPNTATRILPAPASMYSTFRVVALGRDDPDDPQPTSHRPLSRSSHDLANTP